VTYFWYLFAGYAAVWIGIVLYCVRLGGRTRELEAEVRELRRRLAE
jgi:CcmD family protein